MSASTLLLAFDGSPGAAAAVRAAGSLFPGAAAVVANVQREPATLGQAGALARIAVPDDVIAGGLAALDRAAEDEAKAIVAHGAAVASAAGLRADTSIVGASGAPWRGIRRVARERDAAIVVCGSRGLGAVASTVLGSVSSGLVHNADIPVLVVPDPADIRGCAPAVEPDDRSSAGA
jgi:nucleotide-binding universal stress UspA family protein